MKVMLNVKTRHLYGKMFKDLVFPAIQRISGRDTMAILEESEVMQWLPRDEILRRQWKKLHRLLQHAYQTVPYYRGIFKEVGVTPEDIRTPEEFSRLPLLSKDDLRGDPRALFSDIRRGELKEFRTGGSTGEPFPFWKDSRAIAAGLADIRRTRLWWGIGLENRVVRFWGNSASLASGFKGWSRNRLNPLKQRLMNRREFSTYNMSPERMREDWKKIKKYSPRMILGYASALYLLARFLEEEGLNAREAGIELIVSTSEMLYESQRKLIEEVFGAKVALRYGTNEVGELAFECPSGSLHTLDDHVYLELVRTEEVKDLPEEYGEVVVTYLENYGAPLIRYRLHDIASRQDMACSCGLGLGMISKLKGRVHDIITTPDGRNVHGELFTHIFDQIEGVRKFQVVQVARDRLTITIVAPELTSDQESFLRQRLTENLGKGMDVSLRYVDDIPLEGTGKFRWVKNLLLKNAEN
ncbi:MAG: hypothetical protein U9N73_04185 [Candidatus Auribacterota bacterium]|nr:hypothetical protein [Candidatus Auribacterota bacterium]